MNIRIHNQWSLKENAGIMGIDFLRIFIGHSRSYWVENGIKLFFIQLCVAGFSLTIQLRK